MMIAIALSALVAVVVILIMPASCLIVTRYWKTCMIVSLAGYNATGGAF